MFYGVRFGPPARFGWVCARRASPALAGGCTHAASTLDFPPEARPVMAGRIEWRPRRWAPAEPRGAGWARPTVARGPARRGNGSADAGPRFVPGPRDVRAKPSARERRRRLQAAYARRWKNRPHNQRRARAASQACESGPTRAIRSTRRTRKGSATGMIAAGLPRRSETCFDKPVEVRAALDPVGRPDELGEINPQGHGPRRGTGAAHRRRRGIWPSRW